MIDIIDRGLKFHSGRHKQEYLAEFAAYKKTAPKLTEAEFIKQRTGIIKQHKDFRKGQTQKGNWRKHRWKIMKGIDQYHKSTAGKKFHRKLGTFLALRNMGSLSHSERHELLKPVLSIVQHAFVEMDFYHSVNNTVEYELFVEHLFSECLDIQRKIKNYETDLSKHEEFLLRLTETAEVVRALAKKHNTTVEKIEKLWKDAKEIVKKEYKKKEDDEGFFALVVGIVKKMLGGKKGK